MKQICILAPAEHIEEIRNVAIRLPHFSATADKLLKIKLSESGEEPATAYFCACNYSSTIHADIMDLKITSNVDYTEIFIGDPKEFLASKNLKVIK